MIGLALGMAVKCSGAPPALANYQVTVHKAEQPGPTAAFRECRGGREGKEGIRSGGSAMRAINVGFEFFFRSF